MATEKTPLITNRIQLSINWILITLRESAWAPLIIILYYWVATEMHLFKRFTSLDNPSHLIGGIAITYFFRSAIKNSQKLVGRIPKSIQIFLAFSLAGTTMIFWEFFENIKELFLNITLLRSLRDTLKDLFFGLLGAFIFSLFAVLAQLARTRINLYSRSPN